MGHHHEDHDFTEADAFLAVTVGDPGLRASRVFIRGSSIAAIAEDPNSPDRARVYLHDDPCAYRTHQSPQQLLAMLARIPASPG